MKIRHQAFQVVLNAGTTISIVAQRLLETFKKTETLPIRMGMGEPSIPW